MKKISVNTIKGFLKENETEHNVSKTFKIGESSFDVSINTKLSTDEKALFVRRVLSACFDGADNFRPEYVTPMLRATILQMCTNLPTLTLKGEQSEDGGSLMDIEAMGDLYVAMNLDCLDDAGYQIMMKELVQLTWQAIEWRKSRILAIDSAAKMDNIDGAAKAIKHMAEELTKSIENADMPTLLQYAGQLSKATEGLDSGGILKGLLAVDKAVL